MPNCFSDLRNQLALAYEGDPENLGPKLRTGKEINEIFRRAQAAFNAWSTLPAEERTPATILKALDFDFFELLDSVTIARSRKHIETFCDTKDIGDFPERQASLLPLPAHATSGCHRLNDIFNQLSLLRLGLYAPVSYILPGRLSKYEDLYDTEIKGGTKFKQRDREKSLQALMTVNLLKRLESSVESFRLTLKKLANHHLATLAKIEAIGRLYVLRDARLRHHKFAVYGCLDSNAFPAARCAVCLRIGSLDDDGRWLLVARWNGKQVNPVFELLYSASNNDMLFHAFVGMAQNGAKWYWFWISKCVRINSQHATKNRQRNEVHGTHDTPLRRSLVLLTNLASGREVGFHDIDRSQKKRLSPHAAQS